MRLSIRITLIIIIIILGFLNTEAQIIKGAAILGFNASQVDGDEVYGFHKYGFNVGASAILPFGKEKRWNLVIETIFNQKGAYEKESPSIDTLATPYYNLRLNYMEVPVLLNYVDKNGLTFGLGFSWGRLVSVKEIEHGKEITSTTITGPYNRNDFNFLAELRFRLYKQLKFNLRYAYTITPIRTRIFVNPTTGVSWERTQYNNLFSIRLIYVFNEPSQDSEAKKRFKQP